MGKTQLQERAKAATDVDFSAEHHRMLSLVWSQCTWQSYSGYGRLVQKGVNRQMSTVCPVELHILRPHLAALHQAASWLPPRRHTQRQHLKTCRRLHIHLSDSSSNIELHLRGASTTFKHLSINDGVTKVSSGPKSQATLSCLCLVAGNAVPAAEHENVSHGMKPESCGTIWPSSCRLFTTKGYKKLVNRSWHFLPRDGFTASRHMPLR